MVVQVDRLIIPSCSGVLDCFNTKITNYKNESICCLQGKANHLLLMALFSFIYQINDWRKSTCTYTFKMADFKRYIGYTGGGKSKDLHEELLQLQQVGYIWNNDIFPEVIKVSFNSTRTFVTIQSTYFTNLIQHMDSISGMRNKWGKKISKGQSTYSSLIYSTILKERNIPAVELTIELVKLIERRGPLSEGQTAHISTMALVDRCSTLSRQVQSAAVKEQNRILKSSLFKSMDLMKSKTSIFEVFEGLEFLLPDKITISKETKINIKYKERCF